MKILALEDRGTVSHYLSEILKKNGHEELINGIFLRAIIPGRIVQNAVSVPNRALYNESFVYLIQNGKLEFRQVNIAKRQMDHVIVSNGIASGDTLVTELLQGVAPGMPAIARTEDNKGEIN